MFANYSSNRPGEDDRSRRSNSKSQEGEEDTEQAHLHLHGALRAPQEERPNLQQQSSAPRYLEPDQRSAALDSNPRFSNAQSTTNALPYQSNANLNQDTHPSRAFDSRSTTTFRPRPPNHFQPGPPVNFGPLHRHSPGHDIVRPSSPFEPVRSPRRSYLESNSMQQPARGRQSSGSYSNDQNVKHAERHGNTRSTMGIQPPSPTLYAPRKRPYNASPIRHNRVSQLRPEHSERCQKHQREYEQLQNYSHQHEFVDDEQGVAEEIANRVLGPLRTANTVQMLLQLQGTKMHRKEWELIRYVLQRSEKARTDLRCLAKLLEGRKLINDGDEG